MVSDLMTLELAERAKTPAGTVEVREILAADREPLAAAYLAAYLPGVAAASIDEALQEIDDTFAGEFGELRPDLTKVAVVDGRPVGTILVVKRSIWDGDLDGPFIIDLFVHPDAGGRGIGRTLLGRAIESAAAAGDEVLSLRFGEGTSEAALTLYVDAGFRER